jgi:hypothetical protein
VVGKELVHVTVGVRVVEVPVGAVTDTVGAASAITVKGDEYGPVPIALTDATCQV